MLIVYVSALDIETLNIFYVFSTLNKVTLYSYEDFSCSSNLINYILHTQSYERASFVYLACLLLFASFTAATRLLYIYIYIYIYTLYTHTCIYIYIYIYQFESHFMMCCEKKVLKTHSIKYFAFFTEASS